MDDTPCNISHNTSGILKKKCLVTVVYWYALTKTISEIKMINLFSEIIHCTKTKNVRMPENAQTHATLWRYL